MRGKQRGGSTGLGFRLRVVQVRPVWGAAERLEWDRRMDAGHYLGFRGMFGECVRHVAEGPDGEWLALLGWCAGAFKVGALDAWIDRAPRRTVALQHASHPLRHRPGRPRPRGARIRRHPRNPAATDSPSLRRRPQPTRPLVQQWPQNRVLPSQCLCRPRHRCRHGGQNASTPSFRIVYFGEKP